MTWSSETKQARKGEIASMGLGLGLKGVAVLVGMVPGTERDELVTLLACYDGKPGSQHERHSEIALASDWAELESQAAHLDPRMVVLSESVLRTDVSLEEATRRLAIFAPVVVIASPEKQSQLAGLLRANEVDFAGRSGEFISVAAALVERRLCVPRRAELEFCSAWTADLPSDFAEILRHEINNPLTGILGNAELLLSQLRGTLSPVSVQRLETVVDLAVRLRETIRCLSSEWERQHSSLHST